MTLALQILFWIIVTLVIYVYFGYPVLLWLLNKLRSNPLVVLTSSDTFEQTVSLIITANNEENVIAKKLENTLKLDYPKDKLEIWVASDGSTDETDSIVASFKDERVKLNRVERGGKTNAQNKTVPLTHGEIILFSDANTMYSKKAIKNLVRNFNDKTVGAVSGLLSFTNTNQTSVGAGEGLYWRYENFLRSQESKLGSCIMTNASIFGIRKELFSTLDPGFSEDFILPLRIAASGKKVVFDPYSVCYEKTPTTTRDEYGMKVRTAHMDSYGLLKMKFMLKPFRPFLAFQCISHKLLRWFVGYILIVLFLSNIFLLLYSPIYLVSFAIQLVFYILATIGLYMQRKGIKTRLFFIPYYFILVNFAAMVGVIRGITGRRLSKWTKAATTRY